MANRFRDAFQNSPQQPAQNGPFSSPMDAMNQFNAFRANPVQFLANRGINVPQEYQGNPQQMAQYLLQNTPQVQQNKIFQTAGMLRSMFGFR